jgi:hypothetical protein
MVFVDVGLKVSAATSFIETGCPNNHQLLALAEALGVNSGLATDHADGRELGDLVGESHQIGNGTEGFIREGGIKTCEENAFAKMDELEGKRSDLLIEELNFVNSDDVDLMNFSPSKEIFAKPVAGGRDGRGIVRLRGVAGDRGAVIAQINIWFEAGYSLTGDASPLETANQLFRFSGEHGTGDDFKTAGSRDGHSYGRSLVFLLLFVTIVRQGGQWISQEKLKATDVAQRHVYSEIRAAPHLDITMNGL